MRASYVGLIDFAVDFCCPHQCKWLPGGPSPKWPIMCQALLTHSRFFLSVTIAGMPYAYQHTDAGLCTQNFYFQDRKKLKFQDIFQDIRVTKKRIFCHFRCI